MISLLGLWANHPVLALGMPPFFPRIPDSPQAEKALQRAGSGEPCS